MRRMALSTQASVSNGTAAVTHPQWVREIAYAHPDQIVIAVDVWQGHLMIRGWQARVRPR